jgi:hypothetical protein
MLSSFFIGLQALAIHVIQLAWIRDALIPMEAKVVTHFRLASLR